MTRGLAAGLAEGALLLAVLFGPLAFGCVEAWAQAALFSLIFLALSTAAGGPSSTISRTVLAGVLIVLGIGLAQWFRPKAIDGPSGGLPFSACAPETGQALLRWAAYASLLWAAPGVLSRPGACRRLAGVLLLTGFSVAVIGIAQQLSQGNMINGNGMVYGFRPVRFGRVPFGPYFNKAHAGSLLAMASAAGFGLLLSQIAQARRMRSDRLGDVSDELAKLALTAFLTLVTLAGLIYSGSRGAQVSLLVACMAVSALAGARLASPRLRWTVALAGALAAVGVLAFAPVIAGWLPGAATSVSIRLVMYRDALRLASDFPFWGTGLGTIESVFHSYSNLGTNFGPRVTVDHVHNDWIELLLQTGIAGLLAYGIALTLFLSRAARRWVTCSSMEQRGLAAGALAAAISFVVHCLFDFSFQIPANAVIFLLLLCWLDAQIGEAAHRPALGMPVPKTVSAGSLTLRRLVFTVAGLCLSASTIPAAVSEYYFTQEDYPSAYRWARGPKQLYALAWSSYESGAIRQSLAEAQRGHRLAPYDPRFEFLRRSAQTQLSAGQPKGAIH